MRSYSSRVMVCLVAFVESSTMKVDRVLRESTFALTTMLPNSVTWLFGIFSASTRIRSVVGFHSTDAALTSYTTTPPPDALCGRSARALARRGAGQNARPVLAGFGECTPTRRDQMCAGPADWLARFRRAGQHGAQVPPAPSRVRGQSVTARPGMGTGTGLA